MVRALRARQDPARSEPSVSVKNRHEPVPQPEGQSASRPECLATQPFPVCFSQAAGVTFQLPREGRRACLSVVCSLLLFSLLSFFRAGFSGVFQKQGCAVATSAIRGVSRGGCVASPCSGKVPPRLERAVALRAQGADPRTAHPSGIPLGIWYSAGYCRIYLDVP